MKSRCIQIFEAYLQSEVTRAQYIYNVNRFAKYYNLESIDMILSIDGDELKQKIEDYVILFKNKEYSPTYIRTIIFSIQSFCEANDKFGVNWKKIRRLLGKKQKPKKTRPYTTQEIKRMLGGVKSIRNKALILFLSASGVRRGALPEMKIGDLKEMPNDCVAVTVYANSNEEYVTFIHKEAKDALYLYIDERKFKGETITPESPLFCDVYSKPAKPKKISEKSVTSTIARAKVNAGVNLNSEPNLLCHAFRRRFNTVFKLSQNANPTLIERLMGHDMKLDNSYFQPTIEDLFTEYQKGMAELTIDDSERLKIEKANFEAEKTLLEKERLQNQELESRMADYEKTQAKMMYLMSMVQSGDMVVQSSNSDGLFLKLTQQAKIEK